MMHIAIQYLNIFVIIETLPFADSDNFIFGTKRDNICEDILNRSLLISIRNVPYKALSSQYYVVTPFYTKYFMVI